MKRVYIIVEGDTEEEFVKTILLEYFLTKKIYEVNPIKIQTSNGHKGDFVNYVHLKRDVIKLLKSQKDILVTTMVDFFRIPNNIPNYQNAMLLNTSKAKVEFLENQISEDIADERFFPYIQLHEFEALLFSSDEGFQEFWGEEPKIMKEIEKILLEFPNPEDINDIPNTAPSKRLKKIIDDYEKMVHGKEIAKEIGIDTILEKCPRFTAWIDKIVSKAGENV